MVKLINHFANSFFEEEVRNGFTITKKRKEIWAVELDMMLELDKACKALGIKYYIDSGTMLGAARDGHFIPWDDDIDVVMLREDYDLFVSKGSAFFQYPLFLQNAYTEDGYFRMHSQIRNSETTAILANEKGKNRFNQGIFLDVFPLDSINDQTVRKQLKTKNRYRRIYTMQQYPQSNNPIKSGIKKLLIAFTKKVYGGQKELYTRIENTLRGDKNSEYIDALSMRKGPSEIQKCRRDWYREEERIPFEGIMAPVPNGYKEILEMAYGKDWRIPRMKPSFHGAFGETLFDTDKSYKYYIQKD